MCAHASDQVRLSNGIELDLLSQGDNFAGIGEVRAGEVPLRDGRRPMFVHIRNPWGVELREYRIEAQERTADRVRLTVSARRHEGGLMEWMVHSVRNRYNTADWTSAPLPAQNTSLILELRPVARSLGRFQASGFSYRYMYRSDSIPIYKILDRGTWEPSGRAVGNEFWMRNCFVPSIVPIRALEQFHSTEWYLPDCANPSIFQFLPLQTELQGFTFTSGPAGTLSTWATSVAHVRSLFEKPRGQDLIAHWHEHCGDLATAFATPVVEVLWVPGGLDREERFNLYEAIKELVHRTLHAELGMRREHVCSYGMIEEWGNADLRRHAEKGLPKLLEAGARKIGLANHFENNMNVWGVSNMCCTVDYKVAPSVGEDNLKAFCDQARRRGAKVEMWGNTSISTLTHILDNRHGAAGRINFLPREGSIMQALERTPDGFVRNPSNAIEADHYTPVFAVLNLRDAVLRDYWLASWRHAHDAVGLEGIFLDSSFNLSSDKFHWVQNRAAGQSHGATADQTHLLGHYRPAAEPPAAILSQYHAHLRLMAEMQRLGYDYCNEDLGVFGIHRHGPGIHARLDSLPLWSDCICNFDAAAISGAGADPDDVFFRGLAFRMVWSLYWDIQRDRLSFHYGGSDAATDAPQPWHLSIIRAFNEVEPLMIEREIIKPGGGGVVYRADGREVLWAFQPFEHALAGPRSVRDVRACRQSTLSTLRAERHGIYVIGDKP